YSAYLTTVSLTILHAACPYCLTSLALMTSIFIVVTRQRPQTLQDFTWGGWLVKTAPVAAALILLLHLNYVGILGPAPAPEDPVATALADHLRETGVKFYGAKWCPHCQDQKKLFGKASRRLPYIECSPQGQGKPQSQECIVADIKTYPTWVFKGKRIESLLTMHELG